MAAEAEDVRLEQILVTHGHHDHCGEAAVLAHLVHRLVDGQVERTQVEDFQFSLPQFLMWFVNPWTAILASLIIFTIIGFIATYYFLKRLLGLGSLASILGAVFFVANGFYFEHAAVGHLTFQAFPLFAVVVIIFTHPRLPAWLGGIFLSLILTILLYSADGETIYANRAILDIYGFSSLAELEENAFDHSPGRSFGHHAMRIKDLRCLFFHADFPQIGTG